MLSGANGATGTGIIEIYDLDFAADSKRANISTRAFAGNGDDRLIAGFTVGKGTGVDNIIVRGLGPSLQSSGISQFMYDPTLEVRNADGALLIATDGWAGIGDGVEVNRAGLIPQFSQEPIAFLTVGPRRLHRPRLACGYRVFQPAEYRTHRNLQPRPSPLAVNCAL